MNSTNTNNNLTSASTNAERNEATSTATRTDSFISADINSSLINTNLSERTATTFATADNHSIKVMTADEFNAKLATNTLPKHLIEVDGFLSYGNDSKQLPDIMQATDIEIYRYHNKQKLPSTIITTTSTFIACNVDDIGIINTNCLYLKYMPNLKKISDGSKIIDELCIEYCPNLLSFPQDFSVRHLRIVNLRLTTLTPLNIKIKNGGSVAVCSCENITLQEIPNKLSHVTLVEANKEIVDQLKGVTIENILHINSYLISTLPSEMKINGILSLDYCYEFRVFPSDIIVKDEIKISGAYQLREIPEEWIQNLPYRTDGYFLKIILINTGISTEQINRYNLLANGRAVFTDFLPQEIKLYSLEDAIDFFYKKSENNDKPDIGILNNRQQQDVYLFLKKLTTSVSYNKNNNVAIILAQQLMRILAMLADENIELKERVLAQLSEANSSCVDRTTLYLSKLQILNYIVEAEKASRTNDSKGEKLRIAAKHYFYMEDIELYAIEKVRLNKSREDIEFFLAFLIKLAPIFNLPITTTDANYTDMANLKASDISEAKQIIEEKVTAEFENRLAEWTPWNQHQRFQKIKNKKYTDLPLTANIESQQHECNISGKTDFDDIVIYANKLYSHQELIRWYVQQGTDPFTNIPIDLSKIYRIKTKSTSK